MHKIEVKTDIYQDQIIQEINLKLHELSTQIARQVTDIHEQHVKEALIKLGWTPPEQNTNNAFIETYKILRTIIGEEKN